MSAAELTDHKGEEVGGHLDRSPVPVHHVAALPLLHPHPLRGRQGHLVLPPPYPHGEGCLQVWFIKTWERTSKVKGQYKKTICFIF